MEIAFLILLSLATFQSTVYFLGKLKVGFIQWIIFNACAPSNITFIIGFIIFLISGRRIIMYMAILPMFFFGFLGMFVFSWKGMNIIPQIGHIIMTLNIIWIVINMIKTCDYKQGAIGMLLGIVIFSVFIGFQQNYVANHKQDFDKITRSP